MGQRKNLCLAVASDRPSIRPSAPCPPLLGPALPSLVPPSVDLSIGAHAANNDYVQPPRLTLPRSSRAAAKRPEGGTGRRPYAPLIKMMTMAGRPAVAADAEGEQTPLPLFVLACVHCCALSYYCTRPSGSRAGRDGVARGSTLLFGGIKHSVTR